MGMERSPSSGEMDPFYRLSRKDNGSYSMRLSLARLSPISCLFSQMNLASQSVLEALNACFDHRRVLYIAELAKVGISWSSCEMEVVYRNS